MTNIVLKFIPTGRLSRGLQVKTLAEHDGLNRIALIGPGGKELARLAATDADVDAFYSAWRASKPTPPPTPPRSGHTFIGREGRELIT